MALVADATSWPGWLLCTGFPQCTQPRSKKDLHHMAVARALAAGSASSWTRQAKGPASFVSCAMAGRRERPSETSGERNARHAEILCGVRHSEGQLGRVRARKIGVVALASVVEQLRGAGSVPL
ncbi:hypothetical protein VTK73DRAFT_792 [Phialemonium thermophilum]|uniref:Uncharacterized protein n=1 Tax=Phialemonium thermophilum TaxID=223376 RepID=A0ABR3VUB7_9PEZI